MIAGAGQKWNWRDQLEVLMRFPDRQEIIVACSLNLSLGNGDGKKVYLFRIYFTSRSDRTS